MIPYRDNIPSRNPPVVTVGLIAVNSVIFFRMALMAPEARQQLVWRYGMIPVAVAVAGHGPVQVQVAERLVQRGFWFVHIERVPIYIELPGTFADVAVRLLASMFMHGSLFHLLGNMWFLWLFGDNVEDRLGRLRFLGFYLLCGVAAAFSQTLIHWGETIPMIGASGAIAGVLGAYMVLYPYARVLTLVPFFFFFWPVVELPAFVFFFIWFFIQFINGAGAMTGQSGGVAWWAHIGGFVAGILLVHWMAPSREPIKQQEEHWTYWADEEEI